MPYDEKLAGRIRKALAGRRGLTERKMFGGIAFMLRGNMCCGVLNDELILRLAPPQAEKALKKAHTRPFDMTGRPMEGFVVVTPSGHKTAAGLRKWVEQPARFARSLPAKYNRQVGFVPTTPDDCRNLDWHPRGTRICDASHPNGGTLAPPADS